MRTSAIVILALIVLVPVTAGAAGWIGLYSDTGGTDPQVVAPTFAVFTFHIVMGAPDPVSNATFKIDLEPLFASGAFLAGYNDLGYSTVGSIETGLVVDFGGCVSGTVHVGSVSYIATTDFNCTQLAVAGVSPAFDPEAALCAGGTTTMVGQVGYYTSQTPGFTNRFPSDGAIDVSVNVVLSWTEQYCYFFGDCFGPECRQLAFGADPGDLTYYDGIGTSAAPGPLTPNTTYYWSISTNELGTSALWSFTTGDAPLATEETTWSRIKSLYR